MLIQERLETMLVDKNIIKTSDLTQQGIPRIYLTRLVNKKKLIKVARGIYITDWSRFDEYAIFQLQHKVAIYSYLSALYLHGLTDVISKELEVTVYTGYNTHRFPEGVKKHFIAKSFYRLGKMSIQTPFGNEVICYDMERTICDLIAHRSSFDVELLASSLRNYLKTENKNMIKLRQYAEKLGIADKVQDIMEVMYE